MRLAVLVACWAVAAAVFVGRGGPGGARLVAFGQAARRRGVGRVVVFIRRGPTGRVEPRPSIESESHFPRRRRSLRRGGGGLDEEHAPPPEEDCCSSSVWRKASVDLLFVLFCWCASMIALRRKLDASMIEFERSGGVGKN